MGGHALLSDVTRVQHGNVHQALHDELRLEEILALFVEPLHQQDSQYGAGSMRHCPQLGHLPPALPDQNSQTPAEPCNEPCHPNGPPKPFTLTEILPSSLGRWAARNQSPGSGLVTLKTPVVRLGRVQVRVSAKEPGTAVSLGKCVCSGLMTEGAPERKYLRERQQLAGCRLGIKGEPACLTRGVLSSMLLESSKTSWEAICKLGLCWRL